MFWGIVFLILGFWMCLARIAVNEEEHTHGGKTFMERREKNEP